MKKEKKRKPIVIKERHYTNQWVSITSIMMFFIAFYGAYFVANLEMSLAFVKSCFVLIIANIMTRGLVIFWHAFIPKNEWLLIVHGPPEVDSRSQLKIRELDRQEREADRIARAIVLDEDTSEEDDFVLS